VAVGFIIVAGSLLFALALLLRHYISIRTLTAIRAVRELKEYKITIKSFSFPAKTYRSYGMRIPRDDEMKWCDIRYREVDPASFLYSYLSACADALDIKEELEARGLKKDEKNY